MPFSLLNDRAFPVVCRSGARRWMALPEIAAAVDNPESDYAVEFGWPRPDLDMASFELCVGIVHLAFDIRDEDDWNALWSNPPDAAVVTQKLQPLLPAFTLDGSSDGDHPRFMQDLEPLEVGAKAADINPVEALFIDTPGQNGQKKNADLLTHRDRYAALGLPAAAIALYALQAYAPSGGAGNRTSMRGGGPLSAIVIPVAQADGPPVSLWRKILANVCHAERLKPADLPKALPWLAPTLTSDKASGGRLVNPDKAGEAHPLQAFFGMPRRIRLVMAEAPGRCALTGEVGPLVTGFVQKPYGVNYGVWQHPLTPYRRQKEASEPYSLKPKSGRFGYRDWISVTVGREEGLLSEPAQTIRLARRQRAHALADGGADPRVRVGGWAMNNMEAIAYLFAEQPLHLASSASKQVALDDMARRLAAAGDLAAAHLRSAIKLGLFGPASAGTDQGVLALAHATFYEETEAEFHDLLQDLLASADREPSADPALDLSRRWLSRMRRVALDIFDRLAPVPLDDMERAAPLTAAYGRLRAMFEGRGKDGAALFTELQMAVPAGAKKSRTKEDAT
ncbi:type I-E CRISPR-associated protein Cse1/CasA [Breoghania sp.]|uniref:type I-E CRISPR-associated protein Cse1/CasA n=1 Tax=Breoghania sp. TaxID=2065378 RepID=UPI0029C9C593|nr:type I-E CRISPR-associated protein Cse1/CasA [Breoghania sp.]